MLAPNLILALLFCLHFCNISMHLIYTGHILQQRYLLVSKDKLMFLKLVIYTEFRISFSVTVGFSFLSNSICTSFLKLFHPYHPLTGFGVYSVANISTPLNFARTGLVNKIFLEVLNLANLIYNFLLIV